LILIEEDGELVFGLWSLALGLWFWALVLGFGSGLNALVLDIWYC